MSVTFVVYLERPSVLGPIYTKCQRQCCDNSAKMLVIRFSLKTMESLPNGIAIHFWATPLFSMRTVLLVPWQSCRSVDADASCKRTFMRPEDWRKLVSEVKPCDSDLPLPWWCRLSERSTVLVMYLQNMENTTQCVWVRLVFLLSATTVAESYVYTPVCQSFCSQGDGVWADTPKADTFPPPGRHLRADGYCSGRYASYWNAFLWLWFWIVHTFNRFCARDHHGVWSRISGKTTQRFIHTGRFRMRRNTVHLHWAKAKANFYLWSMSLRNENIKFDSIWNHLEAILRIQVGRGQPMILQTKKTIWKTPWNWDGAPKPFLTSKKISALKHW